MKFKSNVLLLIFMFLLSGCYSPATTTSVDSDGDGVSDNLDAYIYDPQKSVLDVTTTAEYRSPFLHHLLRDVIILDIEETTIVETFNNGDIKTTKTTSYISLDAILFGETRVSDWLHNDATFSRISEWSNDFNLDGQAQFFGKSLDVGTRTNNGENFWRYVDEADASLEGGNNGGDGRVFNDVDFTSRNHPKDLSEIDVVSKVTQTWVQDGIKNIVTTDKNEYSPDEFVLSDFENLIPFYAQNTLAEVVASKVLAIAYKRDWGADGTLNESSQFTTNGDNAYVLSSQRPIWANPSDGINEEYADYNYVSNALTSYWYETTDTVSEGLSKRVGKRFVLDETVKLVNTEHPDGLLFHERESTQTLIHETEINEYATWTHYALEGYDFTSEQDESGQVYTVLQKQANDVWIGFDFNEWGSLSVVDLAEQVETLRAGGTELIDINEEMLPGLNTYARVIPTYSFLYNDAGEARTWYLVSNDADFCDDGQYSFDAVTLTNNGLKEGWLVYGASSGLIVVAKPIVDEPLNSYDDYERDWLELLSIDLQSDSVMWTSHIGEFYSDEAQAQARLAVTTERVSVASDGSQGNNHSWSPDISGNGRYVAFSSKATNLVAGDTNANGSVFVYDRDIGISERVSVAGHSPAISDDGRYVAFYSQENNLVTGDTNGTFDVFVHDRDTGISERVSVASDGTQSNNISNAPSISGDGRYVTFDSSASNLVTGDTNDEYDIFVHDRNTGTTERVSVSSDGAQSNNASWYPVISGDGRYVTFHSQATNLVTGDSNGEKDVFVHDRVTGITERVSVASDGSQGDFSSFFPDISDDGRYVTFHSQATNLVIDDTNGTPDVFVHDRVTGVTERISVASDGSQGNHYSFSPAISGDGRYVGFGSTATNLVAGDTNNLEDVFVHDRDTGVTERVSVASDGTQSNSNREGVEPAVSVEAAISADGHYVAFYSYAMNLIADDTNASSDIFVRSRVSTCSPSD